MSGPMCGDPRMPVLDLVSWPGPLLAPHGLWQPGDLPRLHLRAWAWGGRGQLRLDRGHGDRDFNHYLPFTTKLAARLAANKLHSSLDTFAANYNKNKQIFLAANWWSFDLVSSSASPTSALPHPIIIAIELSEVKITLVCLQLKVLPWFQLHLSSFLKLGHKNENIFGWKL